MPPNHIFYSEHTKSSHSNWRSQNNLRVPQLLASGATEVRCTGIFALAYSYGIVYNTITMKVVIDTNVIYAGLRSRNGASFQVLQHIGTGEFDIVLSVPLLFEYEMVFKREPLPNLEEQDIEDVLDYLCAAADVRDIFYLWRPYLKDPKDDMLLEVAVESNAEYIVTFNLQDFRNIGAFGVEALRPQQLFQKIGGKR